MLRSPGRKAIAVFTLPALAVLFALLIAGCSGRPRPAGGGYAEGASSADSDVYGEAEAPAPAMEEAAPSRSRKSSGAARDAMELGNQSPSVSPSPLEPPQPATAPQVPTTAPQAPVKAKRMVHYSGRATLRSTEPEKVIDSAVAIVKAAGGYLEQRTSRFAALRVPAEQFDSLFYRLMRLGEVVDFNQEAEDITEAFQDTELRLRVVAATLERLEALVQKAKTESQKLRLLRELKRFREEKEVLESRRKELVQRARFASIHLWLQGHTPLVGGEIWNQDIADFLWIHGLNPFSDRRFRGRDLLWFKAPTGMVLSKRWWPWRATSSQGSEFWGSEMDVEPRGDSRFWSEAIRVRLKDGYKSVETREAGAFSFCRFQSYGPTPYFYWVGVRSRGDELDLAEFYFPSESEQTRLLPGLLAEVERKSK